MIVSFYSLRDSIIRETIYSNAYDLNKYAEYRIGKRQSADLQRK